MQNFPPHKPGQDDWILPADIPSANELLRQRAQGKIDWRSWYDPVTNTTVHEVRGEDGKWRRAP